MTAPYYADESVTLYHGDCRELLASMPDRSVDGVITDPPYSEHTHSQARTNKRTKTGNGSAQRALSGGQRSFDSITEADLRAALAECGRVTRRWVVATLDFRHVAKLIDDEPEGLRLLRIGAWVKTNPMPCLSGDRPGQGWEALAFFHRSDIKPRWNGGGRAGTWVAEPARNTGHPSAKPLSMVGDWVRLFTDPGDTVFDPFAGSGTTLRGAVDNGRKAVGCEVDERYCELIVKRLAQGALFGGVA